MPQVRSGYPEFSFCVVDIFVLPSIEILLGTNWKQRMVQLKVN